ncbi:Mitochondrial carrier protein ymc2 [Dimargaris xerosporica]|nr:Mitochondrial carrier protein ymc2 [Dimargaris xerosporica]
MALVEEQQGHLRAAKDCLAGSVGGILQVFSGQPFDTIKVRLQTQPQPAPGQPWLYNGTWDCVQKTYRAEGATGFYKGTATPLVGVGVCVSIQFLVLEWMKRTLGTRYIDGKPVQGPLTNGQLFVAGATAGLANSVVSGPVEHIRTRLQVQAAATGGNRPSLANATSTRAAPVTYQGPLDCIWKIYRAHGLAGIYKGQVPTALRECFGYGAYFMAYEYLIQRATQRRGIDRTALSAPEVCLYGAAAGFAMWLSIFPIDVVKSKLQTDRFTLDQRQYKTISDCIRQTFQRDGIAGFYKGLTPCLLRAAPANAATFVG